MSHFADETWLTYKFCLAEVIQVVYHRFLDYIWLTNFDAEVFQFWSFTYVNDQHLW